MEQDFRGWNGGLYESRCAILHTRTRFLLILIKYSECIGIVGGPDSYCARSNDVWALGVIFTSMISGHNPWRRAILTDDCFRSYVNNPGFFREMLPISLGADAILRRIFTNDECRVSLIKLRRMILDADTFFMTDQEIARSGQYVQMAARSYLCDPPASTQSSPYDDGSTERADVVGREVEVTWGGEKAVEEWVAEDELDDVVLSPGAAHPRRPAAFDIHRAPGPRAHPTGIDNSVIPDAASQHTTAIVKHSAPPPQPLPSYSTLLQSDGSCSPPSSPRPPFRSRRLCGPDSPVGVLRRLMDRIFV